MSVDPEERETLHLILDALLNARATLERVDREDLTPGIEFFERWSRPREELCTNGAVFLRRVIGPYLHRDEMSHLFSEELEENSTSPHVPATVANALRSFLPLFLKEGRNEWDRPDEPISKIIADFLGIYWGDEPRFFATWPKRQGLHKRPYRIARLRLSALDWDKYLLLVGLSARERHAILVEAYRTDWDAIRKWANSVYEQFDLVSYPPRHSDLARQRWRDEPDKVLAEIRKDGDAYWAERNSSNEGKDR